MTSPDHAHRTAWRMLLVAAAYCIVGRLGLLLAIPPGYATAVWPPSGIALAAILLWGYRVWPGILIGSFLVNVSTSWDGGSTAAVIKSLALATGIAGGAALEAVVGAYLIRRFVGYTNILKQEIDSVRLLVLGGPVGCVVNATIGVTSLWLAGLIPSTNYLFNWWTWWVGDSIGVILFTPLVLVWALRPAQLWLRKQLLLTFPLVLLFGVVVWLFILTSGRENLRLRANFEHETDRFAASLKSNLDDYIDTLVSVRSFYASSQAVSREEFHDFTRHLLARLPGVTAVSWNPVVTDRERDSFQKRMRAEGFRDFEIVEQRNGEVFRAATRPKYVVVEYIEPLAANRAAIGYDIHSDAERRAALDRAERTGSPVSTGKVILIQDVERAPGLLAVSPFFPRGAGAGAGPTGFGAVAFRMQDVIAPVIRDSGGKGIQASLFDVTGPGEPRILYGSGKFGEVGKPGGMYRSIGLDWAGRAWVLQFELSPDYLVAHRSWQAWGLLATGLVLTGLLGMLLLVVVGRQSRVEELVTSQTFELREAEGQFRSLLETAPDALVIINADGRIELVNGQAEKLFGYSRAEMVGQAVESLMPERFRAPHLEHRSAYVQSPSARPMGAGLQLSARRKDGTEFPVEISLSPMSRAGKTLVSAAVRDITQRKATEQQLQRYSESLERSNRELEQFAYVASHDLQAPLRSITGFSQLLHRNYGGKLDKDADEFLDLIVRSAQHMQHLISDLLAYSRVGRPDSSFAMTDCERIFGQVLMQLQASIAERGALITHDPLPTLPAVALEINLLLQNLIGNAIKFQPNKVPKAHVSARRDGQHWQFSVRDEGIGIREEHRKRIFQVFQRLHTAEEFEGTGIGLSICQKVVNHHGGRIWVESEEGKGSTFYFTLRAT